MLPNKVWTISVTYASPRARDYSRIYISLRGFHRYFFANPYLLVPSDSLTFSKVIVIKQKGTGNLYALEDYRNTKLSKLSYLSIL